MKTKTKSKAKQSPRRAIWRHVGWALIILVLGGTAVGFAVEGWHWFHKDIDAELERARDLSSLNEAMRRAR